MEFDEKVQEVQKAFNEERIKRFAIVSPELLAQSDYIRSLYIRMLCALMRSGKATEAQILFVRRLTAGAQLKDSFTELMRQSMNMDAESISAFLEALHPNDAKFYFVLDGCIACALGAGGDRFAMLAECAELLGVTEIELRYLAQAAKAIVLQSSAAFDEAKKYQTARTENLSLFYHAKWFYTGALVDTDECFHWYSVDKLKFDLSSHKLTAHNIIIENAIVHLTQKQKFDKCGQVAFRNCCITTSGNSTPAIEYSGTDKIEFTNCIVTGCKDDFCEAEYFQQLMVKGNTFRNCFTSFSLFKGNNGYGANKEACFINNSIVNCECSRYYNMSAMLASLEFCEKIKVIGNNFVGCRGAEKGVVVWMGDMTKTEIHDNKLSGSVTKISNLED